MKGRLRTKLALRLIGWGRRLLKMPDSARDPFEGGCVYCGIDCNDPENEHAADCPQSTNVFPVTLQEMWPDGPARCEGCEATLWPGDTYSLVPLDMPDVYQVACTGCALLAGLSEENPAAPTREDHEGGVG